MAQQAVRYGVDGIDGIDGRAVWTASALTLRMEIFVKFRNSHWIVDYCGNIFLIKLTPDHICSTISP